MTTNRSAKTSELRPGDVVSHHGMRLLVVAQPTVVAHHLSTPVYVVATTVLNLEAVKRDGIVPIHWLYTDGEGPQWTIQGNDFATWCVVYDATEEDTAYFAS